MTRTRKIIFLSITAAGAFALLVFGVLALLPPGEPETIVLDNGSLRVHVVAPDSGYYRGARFESAGFILKLVYRGHNYFGRNYEGKRNPEWHDHVCGNAEDFKFPVMIPETAQFLKPGNGIYQGVKDEKYFMFKKYARLKRFDWILQCEPLALTFRQSIPEWNGYAYDYTKRIRLDEKRPVLHLDYALKNTGTKTIDNLQYAHNFIALDGRLPDGTVVEWPFPAQFIPGERTPVPPYQVDGNRLIMKENRQFFGQGEIEPRSSVRVRVHFPDGKSLAVLETGPIVSAAYFCNTNYVCPEIFTRIFLRPGESMTWSRSYEPGANEKEAQ